MDNWTTTILTDEDRARCDAIAYHRSEVSGTPVGKEQRVRIASMGQLAGRAMSRFIIHHAPSRIFEIGTCAGIGAAYMCSAAEKNGPVQYVGMEGIEAKRELAIETLEIFCPKTTVEIFPGHFDDSFEPALAAAAPLQFVYLDGRHVPEPTLHMFDRCVEHMPEGGIIVCDDLDQQGMRGVRAQLNQRSRVAATTAFTKKVAYFISKPE